MTSTKLPTYSGEGSSHHVVQQIFFLFYLMIFFIISFFLDDFFFFWLFLFNNFFLVCAFAKRGAQCVIVGITTNRTRDLGLKGDTGVQPLRHTRNW